MLTRLRQLVLHPGLIPRNYVETLRAGQIGGAAEPDVERVAQVQVTAKDKVRAQRHVSGVSYRDARAGPVAGGARAGD